MYVCVCNAITDRDIEQAVREGAVNLKGVNARLGVAGQCGSCAIEAKQIIEQTLCKTQPQSQARPSYYAVA